jgi:hypothetical protein
MNNIKGFTSTTESQEIKSILVDIGLIIEFGNWYYREYLLLKFYDPMSIKMNTFIRHLYTLDEDEIELLIQKL